MTVPPRNAFTHLPAELRVHIWRLLLEDFLYDSLYSLNDEPKKADTASTDSLEMLFTCRAIYDEISFEAIKARNFRVRICPSQGEHYQVVGRASLRLGMSTQKYMARFRHISILISPPLKHDPGQLALILLQCEDLLSKMAGIFQNFQIRFLNSKGASWLTGSILGSSWPQLTDILNRISSDQLWNFLQSGHERCWPKISVQRCNDAAIILCAFLRLQRAKSIRVRLPHGKKHKVITDLEKELQIACVAESVLHEWSQFQRSTQTIVSFRDVAQSCADDLILYARLVLDTLPGPTAARVRMRQWPHSDDYEDEKEEMKRLIG